MAKRAFWTIMVGGVAASALAATLASAGPAAAAPVSGEATVATAAQTSGTPRYCERIDKALDRRQKAQDRWNGDANTRGSIAWLQARAQTLSASNPELSKLLTDLADLRAQVKDPAAGIVADLQAVKHAHCG